MCTISASFDYFRKQKCQRKFLCTRLGAEPCGQFGLRIDDGENLCQTGVFRNGTLSFGEEIKIDLWYQSSAEFQVDCYLWCTDDGKLPQVPVQGDALDEDVMLSLVRKKLTCLRRYNTSSHGLNMFQMNGSSTIQREVAPDQNLLFTPLSPNVIYFMEYSHDKGEECDDFEGMCQANYVFSWLRDESSCQSVFTCGQIKGNACGDFGLSYKVGEDGNGTEVCYAKQAVREEITRPDNAEVSLWYSKDSSFAIKCFLWCSESGNVPTAPNTEDQVDKDVVPNLVKLSSLHFLTLDHLLSLSIFS